MHSVHHHSSNQALQQLHGYLYKEGGIYKSWKKRWFCIEGEYLKYFVNESKSEVKGCILISSIGSVRPTPRKSISSNALPTIADQSLFSTINSDVNTNNNNTNNTNNSSSTNKNNNNGKTNNNNSSNPLSKSTSLLNTSNRPISMSGSLMSFHNTGIGLGNSSSTTLASTSSSSSSSSSSDNEWIFCIYTQHRTYTLRAASEIEMYYWIQGLRGLQLESNLIALESKRDRSLGKSSSTAGNSASLIDETEYYKAEIQRLKYCINEMKQHLDQTKKDFKIAVTDYKSFMTIVHEQFASYRRQHEVQLKRQNSTINSSSSSVDNMNYNTSDPSKIQQLQQFPQSSKHPLTDHIAPNGMALWQPDASTLNCYTCKLNFTFFRRRHHCRNCGHLFCSRCSGQSAKAQGYNENVKVCIQCAQYLWTKHEQNINVLCLSQNP